MYRIQNFEIRLELKWAGFMKWNPAGAGIRFVKMAGFRIFRGHYDYEYIYKLGIYRPAGFMKWNPAGAEAGFLKLHNKKETKQFD